METFAWIENTSLSIWLREALWAFPSLLVFHALGMGFLVGTSIVINAKILGMMPNVTLRRFLPFYSLVTLAFIVNLVSGVSLLLAYPAKALTNPLFFIKITIVLLAVVLTYRQKHYLQGDQLDSSQQRNIAYVILALWLLGVFSGRFLAYTHTWLLVS